MSNGRRDFIPEKHGVLIRNAQHSVLIKPVKKPRMGLIISDSQTLIWQPEWDKPRVLRFHLTAHMCMDMALAMIMVISCGSFLLFF